MKKRIMLKRGIAYLLAVAMVVGLMVCTPSDMMNVQAADGTSTTTGKTITGLGTSGIADPVTPTGDSDAWKGSYVYFGTYDTDGDSTAEPVKYRVLDSNTTVFGGTTMLLDCDSILWAGTNPSSVFDADSNVWADSDIRTYLNGTFLTGNFSATEQSAIASSTKSAADSSDGDGWSHLNYAELNNDKIFFLDAKEANNESYGYSNTDYAATNRVKTGGNACWWLRSAGTRDTDNAGVVYSDGDIILGSCDVLSHYVGVSPALNVNLSSVLFSSVISGTAGETGAEYKLTLLDSDMTIAGNGTVTRNGDTVTIPYTISGTNSANATQVSVLLLDKEYTQGNTNDAEVIYYGALDDEDSFTLPSDLSDKVCERDYYAYIVAEDVNGTYATDYASAPVEIADIYDEISSISVGVDTPVAGTALDTTATTLDTEYSATTVTWKDGNNTATGNADYDTSYTVNITLTADSEYVFADGVTATVNNHTATVTDNNDGTITVSYTFEKTQMGTITHTATGYEGTYDGQSHGITVAVTVPSDTTVTYSTDGSTYSATNPTFTDAGVYTVYYKVTKDKYEAATGEAIVTITKKALSVTADNQTITEGESIDNSKYTVSGLVSGNTLSSVTLTPSTTEVTDNGTIEVSGAKIVNADGKDVTANYNIIYTAGKLVVNEVEGEPQPDEPTPDGPQPDAPTPDAPQPDEYVITDGSASTTFTVKQAEDDKVPVIPNTGDNSSLGLWLVLLIGSGLTAVGFWKKKKYIVEE